MVASSSADRAREALAELCRIYWPPVYGFIRSRTGSREDAEDLTQGLFESLLARESFTAADPEKGKMRTFLRVAAKRYVINQHQRQCAAKRGGRHPARLASGGRAGGAAAGQLGGRP